MAAMIALNSPAPDFALPAVVRGEVTTVRLADHRDRWVVVVFYPADFTFVCPTEIVGLEQRIEEFRRRGCEILAISVDDVASHEAWAKELGGLSFPLLSDTDRTTTRAWGVLNEADGRAFRASFVVAPGGQVVYMVVSPMNVGRSIEETLRVLDALRSGRLCPADWRPGQPTLDPSLRY
jgi:alkyl hydroperoxide reductase subunit AhpC